MLQLSTKVFILHGFWVEKWKMSLYFTIYLEKHRINIGGEILQKREAKSCSENTNDDEEVKARSICNYIIFIKRSLRFWTDIIFLFNLTIFSEETSVKCSTNQMSPYILVCIYNSMLVIKNTFCVSSWKAAGFYIWLISESRNIISE